MIEGDGYMKLIEQSTLTFSPDHKPAGTCKPGEIVAFHSMDAFSNVLVSEKQMGSEIPLEESNPTAGPLYVEGAMPGDVLAVKILDIALEPQGVIVTCPDFGPLCDEIEERTAFVKADRGNAYFKGVSFPLNPMVGTIGTTPADGEIPCFCTGKHGGNMDCKQVKPGSTIYLPVFTEGALLQIGDLHAAMGDGEICGAAVESAGTTTVKVDVIKNTHLEWPLLETDEKWYVNACGNNYYEALTEACREMRRHLQRVTDWDKKDIFMYLSMKGDAEINASYCSSSDIPTAVRVGIPKAMNIRL